MTTIFYQPWQIKDFILKLRIKGLQKEGGWLQRGRSKEIQVKLTSEKIGYHKAYFLHAQSFKNLKGLGATSWDVSVASKVF